MMLCEDSLSKLDEPFYHQYPFLDMSKIEGKELIRVVHMVLDRVGAHEHEIGNALKTLEFICKFFRTFKNHKRELAVMQLEEMLKKDLDLNEHRRQRLKHIESVKSYQDNSRFTLPYFLLSSETSSAQDQSPGESSHPPFVGGDSDDIVGLGAAAALIVMSNADGTEDADAVA